MNKLATTPGKLLLVSCFTLLGSLGTANAANRGLPDFTELVADNASAVVNISTTQERTAHSQGLPPGMELPDLPEDSPFGDLLKRFFGDQGQGKDRIFNAESLGSGFILSKDGYVITNHHVVKDADKIIVRLSDRRELLADVVGSDPRSDIALLKIDSDEDLPTLQLGTSSTLKVGQWVLAIGSPFGFDHSVTAGIVSAKGRSLPNENYVPFIQTDVAINPGNSGGPLFDLDGKVVGINSQIYSRTGGFMGLSFAIPINVAMYVVDQLKKTGHVSRGWLGVYIQEVTRELAESFGMAKPMGALIAKVLPDSPAEHADLQVGDVILTYNGEPVNRSSGLPPRVGRTPVGDEVQLKVLRDGERSRRKVKIGELPEEQQVSSSLPSAQPEPTDKVLGMTLKPLSSAEQKARDLEKGGLLVKEIASGAAKSADVLKGDVLQRVNNQAITSVDQLKSIVAELPEDKFASVLVQRPHGPEFLALKISSSSP